MVIYRNCILQLTPELSKVKQHIYHVKGSGSSPRRVTKTRYIRKRKAKARKSAQPATQLPAVTEATLDAATPPRSMTTPPPLQQTAEIDTATPPPHMTLLPYSTDSKDSNWVYGSL